MTENSVESENDAELLNLADNIRSILDPLSMSQYFKLILLLKCNDIEEFNKFSLFNTIKVVSAEITFAEVSDFFKTYWGQKEISLSEILSLLIVDLSEERETKLISVFSGVDKNDEINVDFLVELLERAQLSNIVDCVFELKEFYAKGGDHIESLTMEEVLKIYEAINVFYENDEDFFKELDAVAEFLESQEANEQTELQVSSFLNKSDISELDTLIEKMRRRGIKGLMSMHKQFMVNCKNVNKININDLQKVLNLQRFKLDSCQNIVMNFFKDDFLDFNKFIEYFKQPLNDVRKEVIREVFYKLSGGKKDLLSIEKIRLAFDATNHPSVRSDARDEEDVLIEFFDSFELHYNYFVRK